MPVWFTARDRHAGKSAPLGRTGQLHVLTAAVLGLTLLGAQSRPPVLSGAGVQPQDCLPDSSAFVRVVLSGAVQHDIDWRNEDMECGGAGISETVVVNGEPTLVTTQTLAFGGVPVGSETPVDLMFKIQVDEGVTGNGLPAKVVINDRASLWYFETSEWGGCTASVTEQTLIYENPFFRRYRLAANGSCAEPSVQYGGAEASETTVGNFEFIGLAVWTEQRD